jgi:hypothetical protein
LSDFQSACFRRTSEGARARLAALADLEVVDVHEGRLAQALQEEAEEILVVLEVERGSVRSARAMRASA